MARIRWSNSEGTLGVLAATSAVTLSSPEFVDRLPEIAGGDVAAITLDPGREFGEPEIVYVFEHVDGTGTVTVQRARESDTGGGPARDHPAGTRWVHAPTPADFATGGGGGGGGVPDPSGEDDGDVLTVASGAAVWAPPAGGGGPGAQQLNDLTDVDADSPGTGNVLTFNGADWVDAPGDAAVLIPQDPVADEQSLPSPGEPGWLVVTEDNGHAWIWNDDNSEWVDVGPFQGPQGTPGTNGTDGTNGVDGADGADGGIYFASRLTTVDTNVTNGDAGMVIEVNHAAPVTVTIQDDATASYDDDITTEVFRMDGVVNIVPSSGVTLRVPGFATSADDGVMIVDVNGSASLRRRDVDDWVVDGRIEVIVP